MNMTVAMMVAAVVVRAEMKAKIAIGKVAQRVKMESGVRKMETKQVQAPVKKKANIQCEAKRTRERADMMFEGRATGMISYLLLHFSAKENAYWSLRKVVR